ncbi:BgTH12-01137 [Blumeria graminis f. sp. triticale]|uniref:BgtAc-30422 n=2 Tax=Blumeria graminis TaxID=34373 RepID=A0A9X9QFS2_BLUGR|nr:BgTH12-01137 [Blumeria graminis f. sp. triticale]VDB93788.1 BgtAc-30422 [Blumeria graminis f. sp. tritici]
MKDSTNQPDEKRSHRVKPDFPIKADYGGLSAFGDGTYLVAKIPAEIREKMTDDNFLTACNNTINIDAVKRIGQISFKYWYIHYRDHDSAKLDEGKMPVFPKELGLKRDTATSLHFYMTGGLSTFYVDRIGPYTDIELQRLLEKKFPGEKYWMGSKMRLFSFELGDSGEYIVSCKAVRRGRKCCLCQGEHEKGAVECPSLASSDDHMELKGRLIFRP